jgi:L-ascorbate metabolism protein UlaG (beta-lactamase superfamily)
MLQMTHLGGPTVLLQLGGWRILTDPTFDAPGNSYAFGWGTRSTKTTGPALAPEALAPVDVVLLSHDHHADNLDERGRALLPDTGTVLTTQAGARRLPGVNAVGLAAGETHTLRAPGKEPLTIRATPCRHGPPLSTPIVGAVIGFAVTVGDCDAVTVWMTGDTVLHRPVRELAKRLDVDVLLIHLGRVRFPTTGRLSYSMDGKDALRLAELLGPRVVVPVHYEGWSHFTESTTALRAILEGGADPTITRLFTWLEPGVATELDTDPTRDHELQ